MIKLPCRVATTGNITLSGLQTVDGVALSADDRVVVRAQTNQVENGIYSASSGAWSRTQDFNGQDVVCGALVHVYEGSTYKGWHEVTTALPQIGTSAITWRFWRWRSTQQLGDGYAAGQSTAGAGGIIQVSAAMSATAVATGDMVGLPNAAGTTAGRATAVAVGAVKWYAAGYSQGLGAAQGVTTGGDPVWVIGGTGTYAVERYSLSIDAVTSHTALSTAQSGYWTGAGSSSKAVLHSSGTYTTQALKYTYATEATANSAVMGGAWMSRTATQSATIGYFYGGEDSTPTIKSGTDKVTFSTDARTAGGSLASARRNAAGQGNTTRAIVAAGVIDPGAVRTTSTDKYTYATDTTVSATSLGTKRIYHHSAGDTARAVFACGWNDLSIETDTTDKYTYSGDTVASGTALSQAIASIGGGGNNTKGLFHGNGFSGQMTDLYTFSSDARTSGASLASVRSSAVVLAESLGGL